MDQTVEDEHNILTILEKRILSWDTSCDNQSVVEQEAAHKVKKSFKLPKPDTNQEIETKLDILEIIPVSSNRKKMEHKDRPKEVMEGVDSGDSTSQDETRSRNFVCYVCERSFSEKHNLKRHMVVHTNERPYVCPICERPFSQKGNLLKHIETHGGKTFSCKDCGLRFSFERSLLNHERTHLRRPTATKRRNNYFPCTLCNQYFITRLDLNDHKIVHLGETPFKCNVCNKKFSQKGHLGRHMAVHEGGEPYVCTVCNFSFKLRENLQRHSYAHIKYPINPNTQSNL